MLAFSNGAACPGVAVVKGPERRRPPAAIERLDWGGECFEALDAPPFKQAPSRGVGEFISPAPLPSGERPFFPAGDTPASTDMINSDDLLRLNTGWQLSPEQWRESADRRRLLTEQTARLAEALETYGGIRTRNSLRVTALGNVTGQVDCEETYRAIRFLPLIAQRERRPILNALRYFQRHHAMGKHLRYGVVTGGQRIMAWGDLRGAMARLHRRVSRWAHDADHEWNIEVLYRGTEFTRDSAASYHPHANVLYAPRHRMSKQRWAAFLRWSRMRLGAHWQDNGTLTDPDEAIKYPFKPAELDHAPGPELVWLWWETHRMKFAQPMGAFAAFRQQLQRDGQKVVMVNRSRGARLEIVARSQRDPVDSEASADPRKENMILCRTAPQFRFGPFAQPITLVVNYTEQPATPEGLRRLAIIRHWNDQARDWWTMNGAPAPAVAKAIAAGQIAAHPGEAAKIAAIKVHTRRPTVQTSTAQLRLADGTAYDPATGEILEATAQTSRRLA